MSRSSQILGRRRGLVLAGVVVLALVVAVTVTLRRVQQSAQDAAARDAARAFATAAERGDLSGVPLAGDGQAYDVVTQGLGDVQPRVDVTDVRRDGSTGTAQLRWTWPFGPDGWVYDTRLQLAASEDDGQWLVRWSPRAVHPDLEGDGVLRATRTPGRRADVVGRGGEPLVTGTPVVEVGVQPSRATDPATLSRTLAQLLDVEAAQLEQRIAAASPDAFVPVITLRRTDYEPLRAELQPLPGTVFRESSLPLAPTRTFARALLGTAGDVTAEAVQQSDGRLSAGDVAGLSGLQRRYDPRLGGRPGVRVEAVTGEEVTELHHVRPVDGEPVQLTLDAGVQRAAEQALTGARSGTGKAALVAVDIDSGDVLAAASTPADGVDLALAGRYPPGSTFKTASTVALLQDGVTAGESVACPPTATVGGRSFRNFEGSALGAVPFRTAFAQSCNTTFVSLAERLPPASLPTAAASLGLAVPWDVGVDVFAGDVPVPADDVELAAAALGQGRTLASPASMAQVAATVARGAWRAPRLVVEPAPDDAPDDDATPAPPAADADHLATVRDLMREVVVSGTAAALSDVPGAPVHAKTGTAEYGEQSPPRTHAWTIGHQGGLAFAVLVEDAPSGATAAVPVVEAFLRAIDGTSTAGR